MTFYKAQSAKDVKLERFNLIVGGNGTGKSRLVEQITWRKGHYPLSERDLSPDVVGMTLELQARRLPTSRAQVAVDMYGITGVQIDEHPVDHNSAHSVQRVLQIILFAHHVIVDSLNNTDPIVAIECVDTGLDRHTLKRLLTWLIRLCNDRGAMLLLTTHSWDCITAFDIILQQGGADRVLNVNDGCLIRVNGYDKDKQEFNLTHYDMMELDVAVMEGIEVR